MLMNEYKNHAVCEHEYKALRDKCDCISAENEELKCSLDKVQIHLEELKSANNDLLKQVEFFRGQIEAYKYIVNCRR